MGKYIGRENPYGLFETQVLTGMNGVLTTFNLNFKVSSEASILVINAGNVLQPGIEYTLSDGGTKIVFNPAPASGFSLYITYLGRELSTSVASTVPDGNKTDITVSNSGATWIVNNSSITYSKIQNVSATDRILGRSSADAGIIQEIPCTAQGRSLIAGADAAAQRTTLGLGTLATQSGTFSGTSSGTNTGDQNLFSKLVVGANEITASTTATSLNVVAGSGISLTTDNTSKTLTITSTALGNGDKGDIIVSGGGSTWEIDSGAVTFAKMQSVTGPILLGKASGAGVIEPILLGNNFSFSGTTLNYLPVFGDGTATAPSITFTNETTVGIYRPAANTLGFSTASLERMRISSTGQILISDGSAASPSISFSGDTDTGIYGNGGLNALSFAAGGVGRVHVNSSGLVIGNQPFTSGVPVGGQINATDAGGTNVAGANLTIRAGSSTGSASGGSIIFQTSAAGTSGTSQNAAQTRMTISSLGEISAGVGTVLTGSRFTFDNGANFNFRIRGDAEGRLLLEDKGVADASKPFQYISSDNGSLIFGTADRSGTGTTGSLERFRIDSSGRVGIGISTPSFMLEVSQNQNATTAINILNNNTGASANSQILLGNQSSTTAAALTLNSSGNTTLGGANSLNLYNGLSAPITFATAGTERLRISASGSVGVGITSPTVPFAVNGGISANDFEVGADFGGFTHVASRLIFDRTSGSAANVVVESSASNYVLRRSTSSLKYKNSVKDLEYGLKEVLTLRPVTFKSNGNKKTKYIGLIAEEVDAAGLKECVVYDEQQNPDALHYANMVALAFKAIQELNAKVEELEARLKELE